jgi:glyoxylase-like metal-dependent hydrolase (beta-lactamase superfamily II)
MSLMQIGEARIDRAEEMEFPIPLEQQSHRDIVAAHADWMVPRFADAAHTTLLALIQAWIVRVDGKIVVVDPCNGNDRARMPMAAFDRLSTNFLERFRATGTDPADVDYVFCTHLHCDHCGWNTRLQNGKWVPTFPNARYLFVRNEYDHWNPDKPGHVANAFLDETFEDSVRPIMQAGLADLVSERHRISPSLHVEPAPGHTVAHSLLHLASAGHEAYFVGDAFHHPIQVVRPDLDLFHSEDAPLARATRERILSRLAEGGGLLIPAHFPAPYAGRVERTPQGYRFVPLSSSAAT